MVYCEVSGQTRHSLAKIQKNCKIRKGRKEEEKEDRRRNAKKIRAFLLKLLTTIGIVDLRPRGSLAIR